MTYNWEEAIANLTKKSEVAQYISELHDLSDQDLANLLSATMDETTPNVLRDEKKIAALIAYSYSQDLDVPVASPITNKAVIDAVRHSKNEDLKLKLVRFRWDDIDIVQREHLVESASADVRLAIATQHATDVPHLAFLKLLRDSDERVSDAAFENGIEPDARQRFITDQTARNGSASRRPTEKYALLARLPYEDLEAIRIKPTGRIQSGASIADRSSQGVLVDAR